MFLDEMQSCLAAAAEVKTHSEAEECYVQLRDRLVDKDSDVAVVMDLMWKELLSGRRSACFWEGMCDAEQKLNESLAENHIQLRQNYMRLMQEQ
ncbi:MAG: hypothetical protein AAGA75_25965 [Cyanobacteria bacterium P01_E01_bin.6]